MTEADQIVRQFLAETSEALDQLAADLVVLEQEPHSAEPLARALRHLHTLKGSSAALCFPGLEHLAHLAEGLLCRVRDSGLPLTPPATSALLAVVDAVGTVLAQIATSGSEGPADHCALVASLTDLVELPAPRAGHTGPRRDLALVIASPLGAPADGSSAPIGRLLIDGGAARPDDVTLAVMEQREGDPRPLGEILVEHGSATPAQVVDALERQAESSRDAAGRRVRIDVDQLETLVQLVEQLDRTRAEIVAQVTAEQPPGVGASIDRLDRVTSALVDSVTALRRQPIDSVWSTLPRVVRDVGIACGKHVRLRLEGRGTSLDRTVAEALKDPLVHVVRNAVAHGIENPDRRTAAGKPVTGSIVLRAFESDGDVVLEVSDDGQGIDGAHLAATARALGLRTDDELAEMTEAELLHLVFLPGLSTASALTTVSGRGVGMDVAKANVEAVGGSIGVSSTPGRGTTFRLAVPSSPA